VDFDASLDEEFSITTSKQQVTPNERIWDMLKDSGKMMAAISGDATGVPEGRQARRREERRRQELQAGISRGDRGGAESSDTKAPQDTPERRQEAVENLRTEAERRGGRAGIDPVVVERELVATAGRESART